MKKSNFKYYIFATITLLLACSKNNDEILSKEVSLIISDSFSANNIVFVTDSKTGENLFSGEYENGEYLFNIPHENSFDVTYGVLREDYGSLRTIRNIDAQNFHLKGNLNCYTSYSSTVPNGKFYELTISGVNELKEAYFHSSVYRETILNNNSLKIKGRTFSSNNQIFTILENEFSEYKSFKIDYHEWEDHNDTLKKIVNINDHLNLQEIDILFPSEGKKNLEIYSKTNDGEVNTLSFRGTHNDFEEDNSIKVFSLDNSDDYFIKLSFFPLNENTHHFIKCKKENIPSSFNFYNPSIQIIEKDSVYFKVASILNSEFVSVLFLFGDFSNEYFTWTVSQLGTDNLEYNLPVIPNALIPDSANYKDKFFSKPTSLTVTAYTEFNSGIQNSFHEETINLSCQLSNSISLEEPF